MPTHEELPLFLREWKKLSQEEQVLFLAAVEEMVEDLRAHAAFRPSLRVKGVQGHAGIFEMTWAPDGRATFHYGSVVQPHEAHIVWRRVGGHDILKQP
jgi:hypothetical protein